MPPPSCLRHGGGWFFPFARPPAAWARAVLAHARIRCLRAPARRRGAEAKWRRMDPRPTGRSLGLVETHGFVAAVEAADAMTKTARVTILRYEVTRGALFTILVRG